MDINTLQVPEYYQPLMQPLPGAFPCGVNLEYDPDFILLLSRLQPRLDAEYGHFTEAAEPVNWAEAERDCHALFQRSKDLRLMIILMRCRLRQIGLLALEEGLTALFSLIKRWPDDIHPQLYDEGEFDPLMRINALNELEDIHGLIGDLRNQILPKAAGTQITLKIFEKSHAVPRESDALPEILLSTLRHEWKTHNDPVINSLQAAKAWLDRIKSLLPGFAGTDLPDFPQLSQLLMLFSSQSGQPPLSSLPPEALMSVITENDALPSLRMSEEEPAPAITSGEQQNIHSRAEALSRIKEIRAWFLNTEPSSPVIPLLAFTEQTIGMGFNELLKFIPAELISRLDTEKE
ncbi:ImpA family type VI secretion system protein [Cronobacter turicensis]|uniref:type VI secretion system protein TssA n=1 Tax=Cronobacter turicensis TaxID=413502 RepID=UPI0024C40704|nr:type VI secretion system ImpA family N-terminal domain-containing protein [Cronobacter turicensis]MDK1185487.1 type VI secretion system ImpA family N-terminal domain-containing protein [Cronobacter turicensis]MDK1205185.1 type VI secretion system ImpA family N-terminal domain-containing protein [Cronobacter turicensis]MDK1214924.1 type VI secretion system ImpA family N-terminal domain-containing protein [Cronobacter turicensis]MDK1220199.1 type VI secretion system ImpA family N-terminal doma